jgi:hypothetical protein
MVVALTPTWRQRKRHPQAVKIRDDRAAGHRLMSMKTRAITLLVLGTASGTLAACGFDIDLHLGGKRERLPASIGELAWSKTERGHALGWAEDGSLFVASDANSGTGRLARYGPDGTRVWTVESEAANFQHIDIMADDGVVAVLRFEPEGDSELPPPAEQTALAWYDAQGGLVLSGAVLLANTAEFVMTTLDVWALPDGGAVWAGVPGSLDEDGRLTTNAPVVGRLDLMGQPLWTIPVGPAWPRLALTADHGIIVTEGGARSQDGSQSRASVTRVELDGSRSWMQAFDDVSFLGLAVAPSGHIVAVGSFEDHMAAGDIVLDSPTPGSRLFRAELDQSGAVVDARLLEEVEPVDADELWVTSRTMSLRGDQVVIAGSFIEYDGPGIAWSEQGFQPVSNGVFVHIYDRSGSLVGLRRMVATPTAGSFIGTMVHAAMAGPDGRLAIAGAFAGVTDFGRGLVSSGESQVPQAFPYKYQGFIAVYDDLPAGVEVD